MVCANRQRLVAWAVTALFLNSAMSSWAAESDRIEPVLDRLAVVTTPDREDEFPAIGLDDRDRPHVAWFSYDGQRDDVCISRWEGGAWSPRKRLSAGTGDCWRPVAMRDGHGRLWVIWTQNDAGNWDLWGRFLADDKWSDPRRLTDGPEPNTCHQVAVDSKGQLWIAWQSVAAGAYEIYLGQVPGFL